MLLFTMSMIRLAASGTDKPRGPAVHARLPARRQQDRSLAHERAANDCRVAQHDDCLANCRIMATATVRGWASGRRRRSWAQPAARRPQPTQIILPPPALNSARSKTGILIVGQRLCYARNAATIVTDRCFRRPWCTPPHDRCWSARATRPYPLFWLGFARDRV
jgi:hypothetical protein